MSHDRNKPKKEKKKPKSKKKKKPTSDPIIASYLRDLHNGRRI